MAPGAVDLAVGLSFRAAGGLQLLHHGLDLLGLGAIRNQHGVTEGTRWQVKRISVKPGASLSLQMHHHRAEHWVVVKGTALVERDGNEQLVGENQSTYIPMGCKHRLSNPGRIPVELIEVQSGEYLGEDDIVRFQDRYGRSDLCRSDLSINAS